MKHFTKPIRLYWGENYAPKPPVVTLAIARAFDEAKTLVHLYPGGIRDEARKMLGQAYGLEADGVTFGVGIEGLIKDILAVYLAPGDAVMIFSPTFGAYEHNVLYHKGKLLLLPVGLNTKLSAEDVLKKVTRRTKVLCFASPNTTTGIYHLQTEAYRQILQGFSGLVIVDECYYGIGRQTVLPLVKKYPQLLVLRSASKVWGLAGIRLGFAFGSPNIIKTIETGTTDLAPDPIVTSSILVFKEVFPYRKLIEQLFCRFKDEFSAKLSQIKGVTVHQSYSTFIPMTLPKQISVKSFLLAMKERGILLKDASDLGYILMGVPPKEAWDEVITSFQKVLALL